MISLPVGDGAALPEYAGATITTEGKEREDLSFRGKQAGLLTNMVRIKRETEI